MSRISNAQILAAIEALAARVDAVETEARRANRGVARVEQAKPASKPRRAAAQRVGVDELAERRALMAAAREEAMRTGRLVRAL